MPNAPISLLGKFNLFDTQWRPKVIAELNEYQVKLVRVEGEFTWHKHDDTDELFFVVDGELRLEFRDGSSVLKAGELLVVPKGIEHRPVAVSEAKIMLIEPRGVVNTGSSPGALTAPQNEWV